MFSVRFQRFLRHDILPMSMCKNSKTVLTRPLCTIKFRRLSWNQTSKTILCPPAQSNFADFHTFPILNLQLEENSEGDDIINWENTMISRNNQKGVRLEFSSLGAVHELRRLNLFLVKEGSTFSLDGKEEVTIDEVIENDVLATTALVSKPRKYPSIIIENRPHTQEEWRKIVQQMQNYTEYSLNILTISLLQFIMLLSRKIKIDFRLNKYEQLKSPTVNSFLDFLFSSEEMIDVCQRPLALYMIACEEYNDMESISEVYKTAKKHIDIFGPDMMHLLTRILCKSEHARDLYRFHDVLYGSKIHRYISIDTCVVMAALRSGDYDAAFLKFGEMLKKLHRYGHSAFPGSKVICDMLQLFKYDKDPVIWERNTTIIEEMFTAIENSGVLLDHTVARHIANWFTSIENEKWSYAILEDKEIKNLKCPFTDFTFDEKKLSKEECDYLAYICLKKIVEQKSIHRQDMNLEMIGTYPNEFKSFIHMMYKNGPFDIVIDGLNTLLNFKTRNHESKINRMDRWLKQRVKEEERILGYKPNVLIVFRHHVKKTIPVNAFSDLAHIWFASNESTDDPFFMYAAVISGQNCKLVTLDLLRDFKHYFQSKEHYKAGQLLYKWQQVNQDISMALRVAPAATRKKPDTSIHKGNGTWHFPFTNLELENVKDGYSSNLWLVLKRD